MNDISFSVLICVYALDSPTSFERALYSIYDEQIVKPDEIVLVIDGKLTEELESLISALLCKYPIMCLVRLSENIGRGEARAAGVLKCSKPYIAIMDADDISLPDRFMLETECLSEHPEISAVGGYIIEHSSEQGIRDSLMRIVPLDNDDIIKRMKDRFPFNHITVMMKRECVLKAGNYTGEFESEDYDLFFRMTENGFVFKNIPKLMCEVSSGKDMYRRRGGWKYFKSEAALQKRMYIKSFISLPRLIYNVLVRFVVHVLSPNSIRIKLYRVFARKPA